MAGISQTLRELHRLRKHASEIQAEIDRAPLRLKAQKNKAAKAETALAEAQDALKKLKVATHEREVSLKSAHQLIDKYIRQKDEAGDRKAYEALEHEIAAAKQKAQTLEDEILEGMSSAEDMASKLPDLEVGKKKAADEAATFEREQKERLARLAAELQDTLRQLKVAESDVPEDIRPQYQRLVNAYGGEALAAVDGQTCSHCHMQITTQQLHEVVTGRFVFCTSCGRGLYLP